MIKTLKDEQTVMRSHKDQVVEDLLREKTDAIEKLQKDKDSLFEQLHTEHKEAQATMKLE